MTYIDGGAIQIGSYLIEFHPENLLTAAVNFTVNFAQLMEMCIRDRVKGTRNLFFSDFLVQLQRAATLYGYSGIVSYLDENANEIDAAQKILREIKPKGMIFLGGSVANFQQGFANITVPSVLTTLVSDELDFPNLSMVGVDDRAAARTAVSHLIARCV